MIRATGGEQRQKALAILSDAKQLNPEEGEKAKAIVAGSIGWKIPQQEEEKKLPPFPMEALPETFGMFAEEISKSISVDPSMPAVLMMAVFSAALSGKYVVHPGSSEFENLNLYLLIIAEASEHKSAVFKMITAPMFAWEKCENERRAPEIADANAKQTVLQGEIKGLQKKSENPKSSPEDRAEIAQQLSDAQQELNQSEDVHKCVLCCNDATPEVVGVLLSQQGERLAILSDEGGVFGEIAGRYAKSSADPNIDIFLQGYDGGNVRVFRMSREPLMLEHPLLTFGLMAQPQTLKHVLSNEDFSGRGLLSRFMMCCPPSQIGHRPCVVDEPEVSSMISDAWAANIDSALSIPMPESPAVIELSPGAKDVLRKYNDWVEARLPDEPDGMKSWTGKLIGNTLRIAGLLHVWRWFDDADKVDISPETLENAIKVGKYFYEQQSRIYSQADSENLLESDIHYIIGRLKAKGKLGQTMAQREIQLMCRKLKKSRLEAALNEMEEQGYARKMENQSTYRGGGKVVTWAINPLL